MKQRLIAVLAIFSACLSVQGQPWPGSGTSGDPYLISTADHMYAVGLIRNSWNKNFKLVKDIDLSKYDGKNGRNAMKMIGDQSTPFSGNFDGNDCTISNFSYSTDGLDPVGLIAWVDGPSVYIENLKLNGVEIIAPIANSVGSIIGRIDDNYASIINCHVTNANITGHDWVGGIIGSIGGHIGVYVSITNCHAIGNISGFDRVGGIIGYNGAATIKRCFSEGTIIGESEVGGLVGLSEEDTTDSYSLASVSGNSDVGGLIGWNCCGVTVLRCYSAGYVSGMSDVGGLVGVNFYGTLPYIYQSFWDIWDSNQTNGIGKGVAQDLTGLTTDQAKTKSYYESAGWDFSTPVWVIDGHEYPWLAWEHRSVEIEKIHVIEKNRLDRTTFRYLCNLILWNKKTQNISNVHAELIETPNNVTVIDANAECSYIEERTTAVSDDTFEVEIDRSIVVDSAKIVWNITYNMAGGGQQQVLYTTNLDSGMSSIPGDITGEGVVNYEDLALLADQWLQPPSTPSADIAPPTTGDGITNYLDFAIMASHWLESID